MVLQLQEECSEDGHSNGRNAGAKDVRGGRGAAEAHLSAHGHALVGVLVVVRRIVTHTSGHGCREASRSQGGREGEEEEEEEEEEEGW